MSSSLKTSYSILHQWGTDLCCSSCTSLPPQGLCTWSHQSSVFDLSRGLLHCTTSVARLQAMADPETSMFEYRQTIPPTIPMLQASDNLEAQSRFVPPCTELDSLLWPVSQETSSSSLHKLLGYTFLTLTSLEPVFRASCICHCMSSNQMANCSILHLLGRL